MKALGLQATLMFALHLCSWSGFSNNKKKIFHSCTELSLLTTIKCWNASLLCIVFILMLVLLNVSWVQENVFALKIYLAFVSKFTYESIFLMLTKEFFVRKLHVSCGVRSSSSQIFFKIGVLKLFSNFTGKSLYWSFFLINLQAFRPAASLKRDFSKSVFCEIAKFFRTLFLTKLFR